jgi:hypothetical protein
MLYYYNMAVRKTSTRRTRSTQGKSTRKNASLGGQKRVPVSIVFWIVLIIGLVAAFFVLLPTVRNSEFLQNRVTTVQPPSRGTIAPPEQDTIAGQNTQPETPVTTTPVERPATETPVTTVPAEKPPTETPPERPPERPPATTERPTEQTSPPTTTGSSNQPPATQPTEKPVETRDRGIYFMLETSGSSDLLPTKVNRKLAVSDSPLLDSLNALLAGPTSEEKNRGLINFIPSNTRLVSAPIVRGNTAYINFNEDFRYNTFGREGLTAQLKQIVWTATEFSNVHDVQILIDGNRVDFISEGIMIGNPLKR